MRGEKQDLKQTGQQDFGRDSTKQETRIIVTRASLIARVMSFAGATAALTGAAGGV